MILHASRLRNGLCSLALCAATLHGQTGASTQPAQPQRTTGARPGAAPSRATGLAPTSPTLSGTGASAGPLANANGVNSGTPNSGTAAGATSGGNNGGGGANGSGNTLPPAPAATASVQVTGYPAQNSNASADHPLLPIASAGNAFGIRSGTPIQVRLQAPIDSGHARNGDMVNATLAAPIGNLPSGTPVRLTVVQSAPAGRLFSHGELSIQVVSIADRRVLSNTITAEGKDGAKELPDAAPARGTEAVFTPDQPITLPAA